MATKSVRIPKTKTSRPKKNGKTAETVKAHHTAKVGKIKGKKPVNSKSNYGVN
jgi:hypothetical protein